jgi:hypothetical protein
VDVAPLLVALGLDPAAIDARARLLRGVPDLSEEAELARLDAWVAAEARWRWARLVLLAFRLAPTLPVAEGLLRGEALPSAALEPVALRALGLPTSGRVRSLPGGMLEAGDV